MWKLLLKRKRKEKKNECWQSRERWKNTERGRLDWDVDFQFIKMVKDLFVCVLITLKSLLRRVYCIVMEVLKKMKHFYRHEKNNIFHLLRKHCYQKREISLCSNTPFPNVTHETAKCEMSVEWFKITWWQTVHLYSLFDSIHNCLRLFWKKK